MLVNLHIYSVNILGSGFNYLMFYLNAPQQNMLHSFTCVSSNVLISRTRPLVEYLIQRDDGLSQEHVQSDQHPVHDRQDQVRAARWVGVPATVLQDPRKQLERALLVPLGHLHLLHQARSVLLLTHLDDGVEIAASMLALGSESSRTQDGDIDVRGHPPLVIIQINQGHHLCTVPRWRRWIIKVPVLTSYHPTEDTISPPVFTVCTAQKRTSAPSPK